MKNLSAIAALICTLTLTSCSAKEPKEVAPVTDEQKTAYSIGRELPIRPDYVGKNLPTSRGERVQVQLVEVHGRRQLGAAPDRRVGPVQLSPDGDRQRRPRPLSATRRPLRRQVGPCSGGGRGRRTARHGDDATTGPLVVDDSDQPRRRRRGGASPPPLVAVDQEPSC